MADNLLIIFAKYPVPGRVKTRLAARLGDAEAARIYKACAELTIGAVKPGEHHEYDLAVAFWPPEKASSMAKWLGSGMTLSSQQGQDLGSRMHHAFTAGFAQCYKKIIIIGADCPAVTRELILQGFACLAGAHTVMGPATDGGYYLIGLRRSAPGLFEDISWGTNRVAGQTLAKCSALNMTCSMLPVLRDIDRIEDLEYYRIQGFIL